MKYILDKFGCNSNLHTSVFIYGVLASVFSGVLLITALSTDVFKDTRYIYQRLSATAYGNVHNETTTTPLYWTIVCISIVQMISSIFLAIGVEKKNVYMIVPWMIVHGITFAPIVPIIACILLCFAVVSFPAYIWWAAFSIFVTLRAEEAQSTSRVPAPVAATAPSSSTPNSNTFEDIQLPAYRDVAAGRSTK